MRLYTPIYIRRYVYTWLCDSANGRASDLRFIGREFESCLDTIAQWPWASYLHICASDTKRYNLVPVKGR